MDNSKNLSNSLLQSSDTSSLNNSSSLSSSSSLSNMGTGFFSMLQNINGLTWIIIILILAFLGFNVFVYLAKGTQDITNFFNPILKKLFGVALITTGEAVDMTAEGAKTVINTTADVLDTGLTAIQKITPNPEGKQAESSVPSQQVNMSQADIMANNSLNKALNNASAQKNTKQDQDYEANEATSSVHSSGQQGGWCYIGEDRGYRTCTQVGVNDKCMSGDIFPSQEICINPSLRA
jgi:hypothetical protein